MITNRQLNALVAYLTHTHLLVAERLRPMPHTNLFEGQSCGVHYGLRYIFDRRCRSWKLYGPTWEIEIVTPVGGGSPVNNGWKLLPPQAKWIAAGNREDLGFFLTTILLIAPSQLDSSL